ncbi:MAG: DUF2158 domain-containing protein [Bacteroidales bacterium]|nr:DUF2158 domain-containing protein [Bacteroidales bacterium]
MAEIKVGDRVMLKSGGPVMTVNEINGNDVSCQWFEGSTIKGATFIKEVLKKYISTNVGSGYSNFS